MWKSRVSSTPPRPGASSAKLINPPRSQHLIRTDSARSNSSSMASGSMSRSRNRAFITNNNNTNNSSSSSPSSPGQRNQNTNNNQSPTIFNRKLQSSSSSPVSRRSSPSSPTNDDRPASRIATTDQQYWSSLARPRDAHQQLRDEISALRCRIQKSELDMRAEQAKREKYKKIEKLFDEAKQTRNQHQQISQLRQRKMNERKQAQWQSAQEQHQKTKVRMLQLFQEKHHEVEDSKNKMNNLRSESQHWKDQNFSMQRRHVEDLRQTRQINKLQAAASQARHVQQCRDEFQRDVGNVTKELQQYNANRLDQLRDVFGDNRARSAERRTHAKQNWIRSNIKSKEEVAATLEKAKSTEAKALLEERRMLMQYERRMHSR